MLLRAVFLAAAAAACPQVTSAQACAADNCLRAVRATASISRGLSDCSSYMAVTLTNAASTVTITVNSTITSWSTPTSTTTQVVVDTETFTVSAIATTTVRTVLPHQMQRREAAEMLLGQPLPTGAVYNAELAYISVPPAAIARRQAGSTLGSASAIPTYASACSGAPRYSSACSCIGVQRSTLTSSGPAATATATSIFTVTSEASTTVTITVTETTSTKTTTTLAATATVTAYNVPDGFGLYVSSNRRTVPQQLGVELDNNILFGGPDMKPPARFFIEEGTRRLYVISPVGSVCTRVYAYFGFVNDDLELDSEALRFRDQAGVDVLRRPYLSCDVLHIGPRFGTAPAAPRLACVHPASGRPVLFQDSGSHVWIKLNGGGELAGDMTVQF